MGTRIIIESRFKPLRISKIRDSGVTSTCAERSFMLFNFLRAYIN